MDIFELKRPDGTPFAIMFGNRVVPAKNIQVDGYPKPEAYGEDEEMWAHFYPIFFEVSFETGEHWVVTYYGINPIICHEHCIERADSDGQIRVDIYPDFNKAPNHFDDTLRFKDWEAFLFWYDISATTPDFHTGDWHKETPEFQEA